MRAGEGKKVGMDRFQGEEGTRIFLSRKAGHECHIHLANLTSMLPDARADEQLQTKARRCSDDA